MTNTCDGCIQLSVIGPDRLPLCHGSPTSYGNTMLPTQDKYSFLKTIGQKSRFIPHQHRNNQKHRFLKDKAKKIGCHLAEQLNKSHNMIADPTSNSSVIITKLINGCNVDLHHASTLSPYPENKLFVPSPGTMSCRNSRQCLYVLGVKKMTRLDKIGKMSVSSAGATLTALCDLALDTVYVDDSTLANNLPIHSTRRSGGEATSTDNMPMSSTRRSGGEVPDSSPCFMSHILIGCNVIDTSL